MTVPFTTTPDTLIWVARHSQAIDKKDTRIVVLQNRGIRGLLNQSKATILAEYPSPEELFGRNEVIRVTMLHSPANLSLDEPLYPCLYEILNHIEFEISPFRGFCLEDIPAARMSNKQIHTEYALAGKKIPFRIRLFR